MKKALLTLIALLVAASFATAGISVAWTTKWGAYTHDAPNVTDYPSPHNLLGSYGAIWQLIYAGADNAINPADWEQVGGANGDFVTGDDVVWGQRNIPQGGGASGDPMGTIWDDWMLRQPGGDPVYQDLTWTTDGFVYQRVFEDLPGPGTWYYDSELFELDTGKGEGAPAQEFYIDSALGGFQPYLQFEEQVVIPEPATMSLLGLGALALALRRRRA